MQKQIGPYEIVSELGRGGMGVVYKAREESLDRFVAIKMLGNQLLDNDAVAQRFMREARSVADLNHPNLVQVFRVDRHEDQPYFVMEFVEGDSLKALIQRDRQMQPRRALQILKEVATGLAAAHDKGVIHRDIKPENIMLTKYGGVKVVDFGIARVEDTNTRLTTTGIGLGTPSYLSPEVCLSQEVDQRSDIFSLGVVLFEMLTGDTPFKSDSPFELMTKVVEAKIPEIRELNPNVDEGVKQILAKMIAKRPKIRYQNCNELISDIEDYQAGRVPRYAKSMPVEPNAAASPTADRPTGPGEPDPAATAPTTPIPASRTGPGSTVAAPAAHAKTEQVGTPVPESSAGRRLALVAVLVLVLVAGGAAASWYMVNNRDNALLQTVFGRDTAEPASGVGGDRATTSAQDSMRVAQSGDAGPDAGRFDGPDRAGVVAVADGGEPGNDAPDDARRGARDDSGDGTGEVATGADTLARADQDVGPHRSAEHRGLDNDPAGDSSTGGASASPSDSIDPGPASEAGGPARPERAVVAAPGAGLAEVEPETGRFAAADSAVGYEASGDAVPDRASGVAGDGAANDPVASVDAGTRAGSGPASAWNPSAPRLVVVAAGDPAVATTIERELEHALNASSFDVLDAALMDGMIYAEGLADVARAAFDSGADILVYVDVIPAGERELIYYGRQDLQYLANLEVRMVNLHAQKNLGPMLEHRLEYVVLTAQEQARKAAMPIADRVVGRLRSLRSQEAGVASRG